ncbi:MAG: SDR family oxidoreductase [Limnochordia bacterium]|jgi:short-subunit dehydrogenase|nr:SDR family oxidoreductase [Limnochordia bacterium]
MNYGERRLKNKKILITGASGGLGEQVAYEAARRGAIVIVTARREERLIAVREKCRELSGTEAFSYVLDVGHRHQVPRVMNRIVAEAAGQIDVLVNSAGFGLFAEALDTRQDITEEMFRVNVLGLIQITQKVALEMKKYGRGHIINIASQAGKMATPKSAVYAGTKFAVRGYSNALRLELKALGIYVTTVNPGPIRTEFFAKADQDGSYLAKLRHWVLDSEDVAKKIVDSMLTNRREINLPPLMEVGARFYVLFPRLGDFFASTIFDRK